MSAANGSRSPALVERKAKAHRRRFLRHAGLRVADLDAIANAHLYHWARGQAVLDMRDAAGAAESKDYWWAYNATSRAMRELERRLKELGLDKAAKRANESQPLDLDDVGREIVAVIDELATKRSQGSHS